MTTDTIIMERTYDATVEDVWELWTTKDGIESWWGPEGFSVAVRAIDLRPGGELRYAMTATDPTQVEFMKSAGMPLTHEVLMAYGEIEPLRRFVMENLVDFVPGVEPYWVTADRRARARRGRRAPQDPARPHARRDLDGARGDGLGERARQARAPARGEGGVVTARYGTAEVTLASDCEIHITRVFDAAAESSSTCGRRPTPSPAGGATRPRRWCRARSTYASAACGDTWFGRRTTPSSPEAAFTARSLVRAGSSPPRCSSRSRRRWR